MTLKAKLPKVFLVLSVIPFNCGNILLHQSPIYNYSYRPIHYREKIYESNDVMTIEIEEEYLIISPRSESPPSFKDLEPSETFEVSRISAELPIKTLSLIPNVISSFLSIIYSIPVSIFNIFAFWVSTAVKTFFVSDKNIQSAEPILSDRQSASLFSAGFNALAVTAFGLTTYYQEDIAAAITSVDLSNTTVAGISLEPLSAVQTFVAGSLGNKCNVIFLRSLIHMEIYRYMMFIMNPHTTTKICINL